MITAGPKWPHVLWFNWKCLPLGAAWGHQYWGCQSSNTTIAHSKEKILKPNDNCWPQVAPCLMVQMKVFATWGCLGPSILRVSELKNRHYWPLGASVITKTRLNQMITAGPKWPHVLWSKWKCLPLGAAWGHQYWGCQSSKTSIFSLCELLLLLKLFQTKW